MNVWLLESVSSAFDHPVQDSKVQLFRILLAVAVLLKTGATAFLGDWHRFRPDSFGRYQLIRTRGAWQARWLVALHKPLVVARGTAGLMLLVGLWPRIAIAVAVIGFLHELSYEYRFNTVYMVLCLLCLLPAGRLGWMFDFSDTYTTANTWSQFLIVLLTIDLYVNSAYQKLRSRQFISGLSLVQQAFVAQQVRPLMPGWEYAHPPVGATRAAAAGAVPAQWRVLAVGVVTLEALIPFGLLVPETRPVAILTGLALHTAFLGILPLRLAPFTVLALATYPLFVP